MQEFKRRQKYRQFFFSWPMVIMLSIVSFFSLRSTLRVYAKYQIVSEKLSERKAMYNDLVGRRDRIKGDVERLSTDRGIEEEIRARFQVGKPGESLVIVLPDTESQSSSSQQLSKKISLLERIKIYLFSQTRK